MVKKKHTPALIVKNPQRHFIKIINKINKFIIANYGPNNTKTIIEKDTGIIITNNSGILFKELNFGDSEIENTIIKLTQSLASNLESISGSVMLLSRNTMI